MALRLRPRRRGASLVEVVLAGAVLLVALSTTLALSSGAMRASRDTTPRKLAQNVVQRLVTRLRSSDLPGAFNTWSSATQRTIDGESWAVAVEGGPAVLDAEAAPLFAAVQRRQIRAPSDDPALLRLRLLNEVEYAALWNLPVALDLDHDGDNDDAAEVPNGGYGMLPLLIEVRWSGPDGEDGRYSYVTTIERAQRLDPNRP